MASWKKYKFSDFLFRVKTAITIYDLTEYKRVTIKTKHGGVSVRDCVVGTKIGTKKQFILKQGQFVLSKIDARYGAFGIASKEVDNAIITGNFWAYDFDKNIISIAWLDHFTNSPSFYDICERASSGITHRKYLNEIEFLNNEIYLPLISEQNKILLAITSKKIKSEKVITELTHQRTLLKKLRQQILQEAIEGKLTADWRVNNQLSPCQGGVPRSGERVKNLNNLPHLKTFRKSPRKNLTPAEARLWTYLKARQLKGKKFSRQHSIANYILDFYCASEKVAIELDGEVYNHPQVAEYDIERDVFLEHTGIKVLRFENKLVFQNPDGLLARVIEEFNPSAHPDYPSAPSGHLPLAGEEFESASELLARIQAEKAQLTKDKKIKNQKPLPPISEEEKPFVLPDGWVWCRLGDLCKKTGSGSTPSGGKSAYTETGIKFIRSQNVYNDGFRWNKEAYIPKETHERMVGTKLHPNDLLLNITGGSIGRCCALPGDFDDGNINQHVAIIRPIISSNSTFLHKVICSDYFQSEIVKAQTGAGREGLPKNKMDEILVPVANQPEQKAIVTKAEKLLTLCDQLETQITSNQAHAEQLMQAVLKEAFTQTTEQTKQVMANV